MTVSQSDLKSDHDGNREDVAESDGDNRLRFHIIEPIDTVSNVIVSHQCSNVENSLSDDLWKIRKLIDVKTIDDLKHF